MIDEGGKGSGSGPIHILNGVQVNGVHYSDSVNPVQPRVRRSAVDVVDAALDLLDRAGLPALSMRRIAQELGIQPSALYWHFADKQSLLAALSLRVLGASENKDAPTPPPTTSRSPRGEEPTAQAVSPSSMTWEEAVRGAAAGLRASLLAHRDGAELVSSSLALGLVDLPLTQALAGPLEAAGASARTVAVVADTLGHFVIGHTFHEQQRDAAREAGITAGREVGTGQVGARGGDSCVTDGFGVGHADEGGAGGAGSDAGEGGAGDAAAAAPSFDDGVQLLVAGTAVLLSVDRG